MDSFLRMYQISNTVIMRVHPMRRDKICQLTRHILWSQNRTIQCGTFRHQLCAGVTKFAITASWASLGRLSTVIK